MPQPWTFAIATDGVTNLALHNRIVFSIRDAFKDSGRYEIIFGTEDTEFQRSYEVDTKVIYIPKDKPAWITKKKNAMALAAMCENICFMHDYITIDSNWYHQYEAFGYDWDVCMNPVLQLNGDRFWDWSSLDHPSFGHALLPYDCQDLTANMYVSGSFFCCKRSFLLANPLNEDLCWGQSEDSEWSRRVRHKWNLKLNPNTAARSLKPK